MNEILLADFHHLAISIRPFCKRQSRIENKTTRNLYRYKGAGHQMAPVYSRIILILPIGHSSRCPRAVFEGDGRVNG